MSIFAKLKTIFGRNNKKDDLELVDENEQDSKHQREEKKELMLNAALIRRLNVYDVSVPRANIIAIDINTSNNDLVNLVAKEPHSYYPVFRNTLDDIVGIFSTRELLKAINQLDTFVLQEHLQQPLIVSPAMPLFNLMWEMQQKSARIAIIVDEFGGVDGLLSAEDIVEYVLGKVEEADAKDLETLMIQKSPTELLVGGRVPIEDIEEMYGPLFSGHTDLKGEDIDTIGGLVFYIAGRVPAKNEIIEHKSGVEFKIEEATSRMIKSLVIKNLPLLTG